MVGISARAVVPDHLLHYVHAVSGLESKKVGECLLHYGGGEGVLVAFPPDNPSAGESISSAIAEAAHMKEIDNLTILAPQCPEGIDAIVSQRDAWWFIELPLVQKGAKLRNILRRAAREAEICKTMPWTAEHSILIGEFSSRKKTQLDAGTLYIYEHLPKYLESGPDVVLFTALDRSGKVAAWTIGDFTALETAFYMFACRSSSAPPGTSDLLLDALIAEAGRRGHVRLNLGLGIDPGIEFFKRKWGAVPALPHMEYKLAKKTKTGFWAKLLGKK